MTKLTIGKTATEIKKENAVASARDAMNELELAMMSASEALAKALMIMNDSHGYHDCKSACDDAASTIGSKRQKTK